jgi:hypothetical protein
MLCDNTSRIRFYWSKFTNNLSPLYINHIKKSLPCLPTPIKQELSR